MKIIALKTGPIAHPVVSEPQIQVVEGDEYTVDTQMGQAMIDCGWAEEVSKLASPKEPVKAQAPKKPVKSGIKKPIKKKVKKASMKDLMNIVAPRE
jgi:hypothetical protein